MMHVPCGKCAFCVKKSIDHWCTRIEHEMETSSSAFFITLTYDDEHLPKNLSVSKRDLQLFIKRLRKRNPAIRYFAVGEYGSERGRPHYHAVIFNLLDLDLITACWTDRDNKPIGFVKGDRANAGRIRYMVSYMATPVVEDGRSPPFRLMSKGSKKYPGGLGYCYVEKMKHFHRARSDSVVYKFDVPNGMPRYYTDKIFDEGQRRYIHMKRMAYTLSHPKPPPTHADHERLLRKLNRKQK